DYASASAGAFVVDALTSPTYTGHLEKRSSHYHNALWLKPPILALVPELQPGHCWAMAGSSGTLGVTLAQAIEPRAFTIDHIAKPISLQYTSAPKDGEIWGVLKDPHDFNCPLILSPASDVFDSVAAQKISIQTVVFKFMNNWGNEAYTCVYRVRAHGVGGGSI
ncbi:UNC-like C-terminal-domain-containing protein, partial [Earliella scabrosa]